MNYPRNRRIRAFLTAHGADKVDIISIDASRGYAKNIMDLMVAAFRARTRFDYVIVAEFSIQYAFIGWLVARLGRATLIVDWFVGLYETRVEDYSLQRVSWGRRLIYRALDRAAAQLADILITDTAVRADRLAAKYRLRTQPLWIPVGAPSWAKPSHEPMTCHEPAEKPRPLKILYYGNYLPLHGVPTVIKAFRNAVRLRPMTLTLVGNGYEREKASALAVHLEIAELCTFMDAVPEEELRDIIYAHDIVLGIFGESPKARSVIANKVWQGLSCGKPVITRGSDALSEISEIVGSRLVQVMSPDRELAPTLSSLELASLHLNAPARPDIVLEAYVHQQCAVLAEALDRAHSAREEGRR